MTESRCDIVASIYLGVRPSSEDNFHVFGSSKLAQLEENFDVQELPALALQWAEAFLQEPDCSGSFRSACHVVLTLTFLSHFLPMEAIASIHRPAGGLIQHVGS